MADRTIGLIPSLGGGATQRVQAAWVKAQSAGYVWMYGNSPAVRSVVDLVARNIAQLDLRLFEEVNEVERHAIPDHPAALSLKYPSETQTQDQLVRAMVQDYMVFNNAYALKWRNPSNGQIILKPIPAQRVEVIGLSLFDPDAYRIYKVDGSYVIVENPQDMVHWRGWNPDDPRMGLSPLETLRDVVAEDAALQQAIIELSKAGLTAPFYVHRPLEAPEWSNTARDRFEEDLTNRAKRVNHKPVVLEEGMELRPMGVSPRDAQMLEVRKWAIQRVAAVYGVHPASVGLDGDPAEAQKVLYSDVLPPVCEALASQLNLSVLQVEFGETNLTFEFDLDEKLMGNERLAALTSASGRPVMTTNEARAMINQPPIKGGDELVTPANVIVGDNPKPSPMVMPIQDPNKPLQDGSHRQPVGNGGPPKKALEEKAERVQQLSPRYKSDIDRQHRYVDEVAGELERFYSRQAASLLDAKNKDRPFDQARWDRELGHDLHGLVKSIVEREAGIYMARLAGDDFDVRMTENYLKAMALGTAEGINRVTARDIGELGPEDALARARGQRAGAAAASIGTRATSFARVEAAKQAPNPERRLKRWVADTGRHVHLDGTTVPLAASFGGLEPGSEPGCMCSLSIF